MLGVKVSWCRQMDLICTNRAVLQSWWHGPCLKTGIRSPTTYGRWVWAQMIDSSRNVFAPRRGQAIAAIAAVLTFLSVSAEAGPHRARLSRDLADRVEAGTDAPSQIIVSGSTAD